MHHWPLSKGVGWVGEPASTGEWSTLALSLARYGMEHSVLRYMTRKGPKKSMPLCGPPEL